MRSIQQNKERKKIKIIQSYLKKLLLLFKLFFFGNLLRINSRFQDFYYMISN